MPYWVVSVFFMVLLMFDSVQYGSDIILQSFDTIIQDFYFVLLCSGTACCLWGISVDLKCSTGFSSSSPEVLYRSVRFCCPNVQPVFSQVKLWYDKVGHQLIVTILGAKELPVRDDGRPRNPYVKIYFLPDRR